MTRQKKQTVGVLLTVAELKLLDGAAERHGCSRAAVIGALLKLHAADEIKGIAPRQRRPGAGRPKKPPEHPFEFLRHIVPELLKP